MDDGVFLLLATWRRSLVAEAHWESTSLTNSNQVQFQW
jgi:hypothetical protein